jgi:Ser/Thr protein kinase RdoA (MazF antagonist)
VEDVAEVLRALARMHARWWQDDTLAAHSWLTLPSMLAPAAVTEVFELAWPSFLGKLGIPVDDEVLAMKAWISSTLHEAATTLFESGPRTLIHDDIQGDNLLFPDDPGRPVVLLDWQMVTYARGAVDVASAIRGSLVPELRRSAEADLLQGYHEALVRAGVRDYPLARCRADYELAGVIAPARLATAVGLITELTAHPGAFWDTLFIRYHPS